MTLTAAQIRRDYALLRWCSSILAERSGIPYEAVTPAWSDDSVGAMPEREMHAVRVALEEAGVRFGADAKRRPGAVLVRAKG